jgi:hypothetical protein
MSVNETQHGYLLLADISGYTSFVAATELEHAGIFLMSVYSSFGNSNPSMN